MKTSQPTQKEQHILMIVDRSGSMESRRSEVIDAFNQYISDLQEDARRDQLSTVVSLVTFSTDSGVIFSKKPVEEVRRLNRAGYRPAGGTALLDTVCTAVSQYRDSLGQGAFAPAGVEAPPVLVLIFTDGEENASSRYGYEATNKMIRDCEGLGNWTFAYVGAAPEAWNQAQVALFATQNRHDARHTTLREAMVEVSQGTRKMRREYVHEQKHASQDFFVKDVRDEKPASP